MGQCFISYRRDDTAADATALYQTLAQEFGDWAIFKDVDDVPLGADWKQVVEQTIRGSAALIFLVGPRWRSTPAIELELRTARHYNLPIYPVLVGGARMESVGQHLPADLRDIVNLNAASLDHASWRRDLGPVIEALRPLVGDEQYTRPQDTTVQHRAPKPSLIGRSTVTVASVVILMLLAGGGFLVWQRSRSTDSPAASSPSSVAEDLESRTSAPESPSTVTSVATSPLPTPSQPSITEPTDSQQEASPACTLVSVPELVGTDLSVAVQKLEDLALLPETKGAAPTNMVVSLQPRARTNLCQGEPVIVTSCPWTTVPNISGFGRDFADGLLSAADLTVAGESEAEHETVLESNIIEVTPSPGTKLCRQSTVTLLISSGPKPCTVVPELIGMTNDEAVEAIQDAGLTFRTNDYGRGPAGVAFGIIYAQSPAAGTKIFDCTEFAAGTLVSFDMSDGTG